MEQGQRGEGGGAGRRDQGVRVKESKTASIILSEPSTISYRLTSVDVHSIYTSLLVTVQLPCLQTTTLTWTTPTGRTSTSSLAA